MQSIEDGSGLDAQLLVRVEVPLRYGMLYIRDDDSSCTHLEWNPRNDDLGISSDSLVLAVRLALDGHVTIEVWKDGATPSLPVSYFVGKLDTPSRRFAIHDPEQSVTLRLNVESVRTGIQVRVDTGGLASKVRIIIAEHGGLNS